MRYSGAGIIPIIIINKKSYFILFNSSKNLITDAGGKIESKHSILETASRELFEESCGLISINKNIIDKNSIFLDVKNLNKNSEYYNKYYRVYFIIIDNIENINDFYKNFRKFKEFGFNPFVETFKINLIKLDKFDKFDKFDKLDEKIIVYTINNEIRTLNDRLTRIYNLLLEKFNSINDFNNFIKKKIKPIVLQKKIISVKTYEYNTNKNIEINDVITYSNLVL